MDIGVTRFNRTSIGNGRIVSCKRARERQIVSIRERRINQRQAVSRQFTVIRDCATCRCDIAGSPRSIIGNGTARLCITDTRFDCAKGCIAQRRQCTAVNNITAEIEQLTSNRHRCLFSIIDRAAIDHHRTGNAHRASIFNTNALHCQISNVRRSGNVISKRTSNIQDVGRERLVVREFAALANRGLINNR